MQKAAEMAKRVQQNEQPGKPKWTPKSSKALSNEVISGVFAVFRARYGHQWTSRFANEREYTLAKGEWSKGLGGLTGAEIRAGVERWQETHPPNYAEFREACRPKTHAAQRKYLALPKPTPNPDIAKKAFETMKNKLRE